MTIQRRDLGLELRAETRDDGKRVIRGYAVRYGVDSNDLGGFVETIDRDAFTELIDKGGLETVALYNHNPDHLLARMPSTLSLRNDDNGLFIEADLPDTELGRSVHTSIERGDLKGQSFSFSDFEATWNDDFSRRNITKINKLYDVGPVTFPAYDDTSVTARDRDAAMKAAAEERKAAVEAAKQAAEAAKLADAAKKPTGSQSMDPKELRAKAQEWADAADKITSTAKAEERELTDDEVQSVKDATKQSRSFLDRAQVLEEANEQRKALEVKEERKSTPDQPEQRNQPVARQRVTYPLRHNLRSYKASNHGSIQAANDAAYRSGMFLLASLWKAPTAVEYCRTNGIPITRSNLGQSRAMGINVNVSGGYLVPDEMERAIINIIDQFGVARRLCRMHRMSTDTMNVPIRDSGLTAYAIGENTSITASDKAWTSAELVARKWGVLVRYSTEVNEDSIIDMADDLTNEIGSVLAESEDDAWLNGDGSNTYHGIHGIWTLMEANTWTGSLFDAASGNDTLAEVDADDLALLYGKMPFKYRNGGVWLCNPFTKATVFDAIMSAAGGNTQNELREGQPSRYAGYDIIESEKFYAPATASTVANDKVPILFGRFDIGCSFGARRGMTVALSEDRYFELDQLAIRGTERFDVSNHNANPGTAVGPITGLALTT